MFAEKSCREFISAHAFVNCALEGKFFLPKEDSKRQQNIGTILVRCSAGWVNSHLKNRSFLCWLGYRSWCFGRCIKHGHAAFGGRLVSGQKRKKWKC
jgi:hypothetical protein